MERILVQGDTYWTSARASRWRALVDGDAYFKAFRAAALKARRSLIILGWDIDSRLELCRSEGCGDIPTRLGALLDYITALRPRLHVYILLWDFAMIYSLDRQVLPVYHFAWKRNRRVHFYMDGSHPVGASHHQKIVVVDDILAMSGGMDLSGRRWDTPDHLPCDPRRSDPGGEEYRPLHDLQVMVDGPAASTLAELARDRFRRAGLRPPPYVRPGGAGPSSAYWPEEFSPELTDVDVAIARTYPPNGSAPEVREVEAQYLAAIRNARRYIFIENQYLTCSSVGQALIERLREQDGPEILILLPHGTTGWLEEATMGVLRARLIRDLQAADRHGRLAMWSPMMIQNGDELYIKIHAKMMIVDGRYLRIGSSNLNNRSMGLDSECDLSIEADGPGEVQEYIRELMAKILSEHTGVALEPVLETLRREESLIRAVQALAAEGDVPGKASPHIVLRPTDPSVDELYEDLFPGADMFIDPERPSDPAKLLGRIIEGQVNPGRPVLFLLGLILAPLALWMLWDLTPLQEVLSAEAIAQFWSGMQRAGYATLLALAAFVIGAQVAFPVTILIAATAIAFPPLQAIMVSVVGSFGGALVGYALGRLFGRDMVRRLAGRRINRISDRLARKGLAAVAMLRIVPVAPFTLINFVSGASNISLRDYLAGTAVGMTPGIIAFTLLGESILGAFTHPGLGNISILVGALILPMLLAMAMQRILTRKDRARNLPTA